MGDWTRLGRRIEPAWSPGRSNDVRRSIVRRKRRRTAVVGVGVLTIAAVAFWIAARPHGATVVPRVTPHERIASDTALPVTDDTDLVKDADRVYTLGKGAARFVVTHDEAHPFVVHAGDVLVEDVGTVFTVAFSDAEHVSVAVESGVVRVHHDGKSSEVHAGEHIEVPASEVQPMPLSDAGIDAPHTFVKRDQKGDGVALLLSAADDARAGGRPQDAVEPLSRIVHDHPDDARADVAAFTLGRLLLEDLDRPSEAADAFAMARSRGGPMTEDALAREATARQRAGDGDRARTLADEYLRSYPQGMRRREMAKFASPP